MTATGRAAIIIVRVTVTRQSWRDAQKPVRDGDTSRQREREIPLNLWELLANTTVSLLKTEFVFSALGLDSVKIFDLYLRSFVFLCKHYLSLSNALFSGNHGEYRKRIFFPNCIFLNNELHFGLNIFIRIFLLIEK